LGRAGRDMIVAQFSLDAMVEQLVSVYRAAAS
jgi:hypothetical protein